MSVLTLPRVCLALLHLQFVLCEQLDVGHYSHPAKAAELGHSAGEKSEYWEIRQQHR